MVTTSPLSGRSAADHCCKFRRIAIPLDRDFGEGALDISQITLSQLDVGRANVFFQPVQLRGAGYRYDPGFLREQPGKSDLRRSGFLARRDLCDQVDERLVRLTGLGREAWRPQMARLDLACGGHHGGLRPRS